MQLQLDNENSGVYAGILAHNWICFYVIFKCGHYYDQGITAMVVCIQK